MLLHEHVALPSASLRRLAKSFCDLIDVSVSSATPEEMEPAIFCRQQIERMSNISMDADVDSLKVQFPIHVQDNMDNLTAAVATFFDNFSLSICLRGISRVVS